MNHDYATADRDTDKPKSRSEAHPSHHATRTDIASQPLYLTHTLPKEDDDIKNDAYEKIPTSEYILYTVTATMKPLMP